MLETRDIFVVTVYRKQLRRAGLIQVHSQRGPGLSSPHGSR